jgi:starch synthase
VNVLFLTREYPPHVYGGAGVVVDHLSRALARRASMEVRCFGDVEAVHHTVRIDSLGAGHPAVSTDSLGAGHPAVSTDSLGAGHPPVRIDSLGAGHPPVSTDSLGSEPNLVVRGYPTWERLAGRGLYAPALEALSAGLAMAADPSEADVVHSHTWYVGLGALLVKKLHDIPLVVTLHSIEPLRPWKADQLGRGYDVSTWAERAAVEQAERVIAVSGTMRDDILSHFEVDPARVVTLHNGVDAEAFRATARRDALERHGVRPPYALFVGRISEQKGIFPLLEAAESFPTDLQLALVAASPDTPEMAARLAAAVANRPRVRWINAMLPHADVVELYTHATVFVCPSIYEPFGLINLEAMACGTAVAASRVGGIPEVVVDGETGVLVPPGDPVALAAAVRAIAADPERAARLGRAGRKRVEAEFSWTRIADRTLAVYADAIADRHQPSRSRRNQATLHGGSVSQASADSPRP